MAVYLDDDFQGYAIGTHIPFGPWTGGTASSIIAGGNIIPTTDRSIEVNTVDYDRGALGYLNSFSQFFAVKLASTQPFIFFDNGPNGSGNSFTLFQLRLEPDSTLTAECPVSGQILANSGDFLCPFSTWHFFQVNLIFSDVLVAGVLHLNIQCEVGLNGVSVLSFNITTASGVGAFANGTSEVRHFKIQNGVFGAYTLDVHQALIAYPHVGTPSAIVKQGVIELDTLPNTANIDVYQGAIELDILPNTAQLRVMQAVIEIDRFIREPWYITES